MVVHRSAQFRILGLAVGICALLLASGCGGPQASPSESRREAVATDALQSIETVQPHSDRLVWHVGDVDPRFGVSIADFRSAIEKAIALWESEAGRRLFEEEEGAGFPIQMVYDERQQRMDEMKSAKEELAQQRRSLDATQQGSRQAMRAYEAARTRYHAAVNALDARIRSYNRQIDGVNAAGGADDELSVQLDAEKARLADEKSRLVEARRALEELADQSDRLAEIYNSEAERFNDTVRIFNERFGRIYQVIGQCRKRGGEIEDVTVYAFRNLDHLAIVLAHELGHALGVEHVEGDGALMSAVEKGRRSASELRLSSRDRAALQRVLGK